jgi:hypothetical protein
MMYHLSVVVSFVDYLDNQSTIEETLSIQEQIQLHHRRFSRDPVSLGCVNDKVSMVSEVPPYLSDTPALLL